MLVEALELGHEYTRNEIHELVGGGSIQSYLPHADGKILCGCFDPNLNQRAPREIDVGEGRDVLKYAQLLSESGSAIPVFLKQATNAWEFAGDFRAVSFSQDPRDVKAHADRRPDAVGVLFLEEVLGGNEETIPSSDLIDKHAREGRKKLLTHLRRERSRHLSASKKSLVRQEKGELVCEACGLVSSNLPEQRADACFEVHHLIPLSQLSSETITKIDDLALICANCHRMIHRNPMLGVEQLREVLSATT